MAIYAVLFAVFIATVTGMYFYGRSKAGKDFDSLLAERDALIAQQSSIENENTRLNETNIALQRESQVEKEGYRKIDTTLRELQSEVLELKEEVAFYRSIVAPREASRGIRVQRFQISRNGDTQSYRYKLVLTQVIKRARKAKGKIVVMLKGVKDGKHTQLTLKDITDAKDKSLPFNFRYFQSFDGDIILPEGFSPSRVELKIVSKRAKLEKKFSWSSLLSS